MKVNRKQAARKRGDGSAGRKPVLGRWAMAVATVFMLSVVLSTGLSRPAWAAYGVDPEFSASDASPGTVTADGTSSSTVSVLLEDDAQQRLVDWKVVLTVISGSPVISPSGAVGTDQYGVASFTVTDTKAETVELAPTVVDENLTLPSRCHAWVHFVAGPAVADKSTVSAGSGSVTADGTNCSTITVTLEDKYGNLAGGRTVTLTGNSGSSSVIAPASPGSNVTNGNGQATFTVTDTKAETVTYTATDTSDNVTVNQTAPVTFTPNGADAGQSTLTVDTPSQWADGTSYSTITVTLKSAAGHPATGKTVTLTGNPGSSSVIKSASPGSNVTNGNGQATFTVTDTKVETVTYTATDTSDTPNVTVSQTLPVTFTAGPPDASKCKFTAKPARVAADGTSASTLTVALFDAQGRPVSRFCVPVTGYLPNGFLAHAAINGITVPQVPGTTQSDGTVTYTVTDNTPETVTFAASLPNMVTINFYPTVTFYSPVDAAQSTVTASRASVRADGTSTATITATLKNANGNAVPGKVVTLAANSAHSMITTVQGTTDNNGQATFLVSDTRAETVTYTVQDGMDNLALNQTAQVTFTPDLADPLQSTVTAGPASVDADGTSSSTITVTLADTYGFPVSSHTVSLAAGSGNSVITTVQGTTDNSGQATFLVSDTRAETVTYTATDTTDHVALDQRAAVTFVQPTGVTPVPAIDTPVVAGATSVGGTAQPGASVTLSVNNGTPHSTTADANGNWTVNGLALSAADTIAVTAQAPGESASPAATTTVQAALVQTPAPSIDTPVGAGATSVSGTAATGATIALAVDNGTSHSTTAGPDGHWTVGGLAPLVAGDTIAVTAQAPGESASPAATATVASGGGGTQNDPYLIGSAAQLAAIRNTVNQPVYYRLTADIDLGGVAWTPLGTDSLPFAGHFDGQGHVISNLTVVDPTGSLKSAGLFGCTAAGSTIANVGLRNASLNQTLGYVGGLAGLNQGSVTDCFVTGGIAVQTTGSNTWITAGGLVGWNKGSVTDCYATDSVAVQNLGGGSYAIVGGLVGLNDGSVTDCYATGSVSVNNGGYTGGLAGGNNPTGTITRCYATGSVSVNNGTHTGGLTGGNYGTITDSYYDGTTTGLGGGETDSLMKQQATFSGWDFTGTWGIHEGLGYPYLLGFGLLPVTVSASPSVGGAVYGGGPYNVGDRATVYAGPDSGYTFTGWTDGGGNTVSGSVYYSFTMGSSPVVLVAHFTGGTPAATPTPTIATPVQAGATSVSGTAQPGAAVTLSVNGTSRPAVNAGANGAWTVSVPALSAGDSISVTAQAAGEAVSPAQTATVVFQATKTPIPAINTPVYYRASSVGGTAQPNAAIELTLGDRTSYFATADVNGNWTVGGLNLFVGETISATAQTPGEAVSPAVTTTVLNQTPTPAINTPVYAGATSVGGTAAGNATVTLSVAGSVYNATASAAGTWTVSGLPALTAGQTISVTAQSPGTAVSPAQTTTVVGHAAPQTPAPAINTPVYAGATSVNGTAPGNATVTLSVNGTLLPAVNASANGYWTVGGLTLNTGDIIAVTAQAPGETASPAAAAVVAAAGGGLAISPAGGSYAAPLTVTISDSGLSVGQAVYYSTAGDPASVTGASYFAYPATSCDLTLNAPATVCARVYDNGAWGGPVTATYNVSGATYPLAVQASPAADGSVTGGGDYPAGASVPLSATADSGCAFVDWTDAGGNVVSFSASFNYTMPATSATLTANFTAAPATSMTISGFAVTNRKHQAVTGTLTHGGQYYVSMTVYSTSTATQTPMLLIEAQQGGQVIALNSVQARIAPGGNSTVSAMFTPPSAGTVTLEFFAWSDWTDLGGQPLAINKQASEVVQ